MLFLVVLLSCLLHFGQGHSAVFCAPEGKDYLDGLFCFVFDFRLTLHADSLCVTRSRAPPKRDLSQRGWNTPVGRNETLGLK